MASASKKRNRSGEGSQVKRNRLFLSAAATAALLGAGVTAKADLAGFSGFSPFNTNATTDTALGFSTDKSALTLTTATNGEVSSAFSATGQNISSFTLSYTYQTTPQIPHAYGSSANSLEADGATITFLPSTDAATALGAGGGGLGYNGIAGGSLAVATQLFDGYYSYGGGSQLGSNGSITTSATGFGGVDLSTGDAVTVRISYSGTNLSETVVDATQNQSGSVLYSNVNLATTLGTSTALVGFTGSTGGYNAGQKISNFQFVAAPTYTPITLSGFNQNMVIPASAPQSGATAYITASMDQGTANVANNVWYEKGYDTAAPTTGLPTSGSTFTSQLDTTHQFTMQSYTSTGDAILLSNSTNDVNLTGTLTLANPAAFKAISILESSGNGPNYFNVIINYKDGAASTVIPEVLAPNWFGQTANVAYIASGRAVPSATTTTSFNNVGSTNPELTQQDITLPDSSDPISSITFNYASGSGNTAIFAVSGVVASSTTLKYGGNDPTTPGQFDNGLTQNFNNGSGNTSFLNGDIALFDDTATGTHTVSVASSGVAPSSVIFNNSSSTYTINGPGSISGTGGLTVSGGGLVTINNSNTYTGGTSVSAGTLVLGATSSTASAALTVASGALLNISSGAALTSSSLTLNDNGTVNLFESLTVPTLTGSGAVNLSSTGLTLTLTKGGGFTGTVNGNGATLALSGSGGTFAGTYTASTGSSPNVAIVNTTGTWLLSGSSTYAGGTTLTAGIAQAGNNSSFGTGPIILNGGSLSSSVPVNLSNLITGSTLTIAAGSSTVELSNSANTYTGPVSVLGGTLEIDSEGALGSATSINVSSGATFEANSSSGAIGAGTTLTIAGSGVTSTLGAPLVNGPVGALRGQDDNATIFAGNIVLNGAAQISPGADGTLTLTGAISGTGPLTITGNPGDQLGGTTVLAPAAGVTSTYTGETILEPTIPTNTLYGTTLKLGANNGISTASGLNISGGSVAIYETFDLAGYNQSLTYLTGSAPVNTGSPTVQITNSGSTLSTLTITSGLKNGSPATSSTPINGNVAVVMNDPTGLGTQILNGASSYGGGTTITSGRLTVASATGLGSSTVTLNGGTLGLGLIQTASATPIVTGSNFSSFQLNVGNGSSPATVSGTTLQITTGGAANSSNSAFYPTPVTVSDSAGFTAKFSYYPTNGYADGAAFVLQTAGPTASSTTAGGGLGYVGGNYGNSAAVLFNIYNFAAAGGILTTFDTGAAAATNYIDTVGVNGPLYNSNGGEYYNAGQVIDVTLLYDGVDKTLTETLYGESSANTFTTTYTGIDYSSILGGTANGSTSAYIGFTGATGGATATQTFTNFSYSLNVASSQGITNAIVGAANTSSSIQIQTTSASTSTLGAVGPVTINTGATIKITNLGLGTRGVFAPQSLTIATSSAGAFTGTLDLGSNDMDLPTSSGTTLAQVTALVASGYNKGLWTGTGIDSSAAAADSKHLTALGVIANNGLYGAGGSISSTFDGSVPGSGDTLVKYTYYGDANLDGAVDGSDYTLIDAGYNADKATPGAATGWYNGDFNYDGKIDGSDYTLIDNAFNTQGASLGSNPANEIASSTALIAGATGSSAVPEPATLGLLGIGALGLLGKRRRK